MIKPKIIPSLLACKKSAQFIDLFWVEIKQILESQPYLTMCIPKVTFSFPDALYEHAKNQLNSFILQIQQIMESHDLKGHTNLPTQ